MIPWPKFFGFATLFIVIAVSSHLLNLSTNALIFPYDLSTLLSALRAFLPPMSQFFLWQLITFIVSALIVLGFIFIYKSEHLRKYFFLSMVVLFALMLLFFYFPRPPLYFPYLGI